jgi:uncharacterized membrane protein YccC
MSPRPGRPRASASSGTTGASSPAATAAGRVAGGWRGAMRAVRVRDPGGASLRRAGRVAIVVPTMAAFAGTVVGDPAATTFAVFGTFALLGLADFGGPTIPRARAYAGATVVGAGLVLLGTLASGGDWSAVAGTALVTFVVQFLGVFGGYVAAAQTALLLAFVVAVSLPAPAAAGWARVAGWTLAGGICLAAAVLLWPRHARTQVRQRAGEACQALAELLADPAMPPTVRDKARAQVEATRRAHGAVLLRPAGPANRDRALVDLVLELGRALEFAGRIAPASNPTRTIPEEGALRQAIREVLEASAGVLTGEAGPPDLAAIDQARAAYREALDRWAGDRLQAGDPAESVLEGLDAGGRLRLLAHATLAVAVDAAAVAGHAVHDPPSPLPHWRAPRAGAGPWLGRVAATLRTHLRPTSVWFRNSLRAALALGLAVLLTRITRVEHSFWVVLGTLSVLRSNALGTGRTALLAIGGTVVGFVVAAVLTLAIGTSTVALWVTLPIVAFLAAYVPTAVSFLVGQAAFTLFVVALFDLLQPQGWRLGLVRLEDIALGVGVSIVVAVLLWPRGARGQLGSALAALYRADAALLEAAFGYLLGDGDQRQVEVSRRAAETEVDRAAAAFEVFLTERGSRTLPTVTWARIGGAGNDVLFAADAMALMGLLGYRTNGCQQCADRIRRDAAAVVGVFTGFAGQLQQRHAPPAPPIPAAATRDAVVGCLRAWRGAPDSPLGPTAIALATAWFWNTEMARLGGELAQPLAAVAAAAQSPWWR